MPWKEPGARGYNRGHKIEVEGTEYQVCKNCGLFEHRHKNWLYVGGGTRYHWTLCWRGYESNRGRLDRSKELEEWKEGYKRALEAKEEIPYDWDALKVRWHGLGRWNLGMHGLPPSCL